MCVVYRNVHVLRYQLRYARRNTSTLLDHVVLVFKRYWLLQVNWYVVIEMVYNGGHYLGVSVEMPSSESDSSTITLRGPPEKLGVALTQVYEKVQWNVIWSASN